MATIINFGTLRSFVSITDLVLATIAPIVTKTTTPTHPEHEVIDRVVNAQSK
jgi:hypothetical protein